MRLSHRLEGCDTSASAHRDPPKTDKRQESLRLLAKRCANPRTIGRREAIHIRGHSSNLVMGFDKSPRLPVRADQRLGLQNRQKASQHYIPASTSRWRLARVARCFGRSRSSKTFIFGRRGAEAAEPPQAADRSGARAGAISSGRMSESCCEALLRWSWGQRR
jgi:hypothetical protein